MSQNIKQLYKDFCKKNNRDYFMNYTEMITVLKLNPKSSRKTNYNIINSFCQTENDGHKIRLTNFAKTKQFNKALQIYENHKYSFNTLIREFFLLLNRECEKVDYYIDGKYYLTKADARVKLGFIKPSFTSKSNINYIAEEINLIRDKLLPNSDKCTSYFVEEYLFNMKSIANTYIKDALTNLPEINCEKIYVLFDSEWEKTYITDANIINEFENEQKSIFKDICDASNKNISKVRDLIFFKAESNEYYQKSLEYLQKRINRNTVRFEQGYRISINGNITYEPLGLSINEIREKIANKFHKTMVTHIKNQRKKVCSISEEQETMNIAQMQIEEERNDILYSDRSKKQAIQRAGDDNIFKTGFINFLLINDTANIKSLTDELEEYILPEEEKTINANKEMKKIIRKMRDKYKYILEDMDSYNKKMQKEEKILKQKIKLTNQLNDTIYDQIYDEIYAE